MRNVLLTLVVLASVAFAGCGGGEGDSPFEGDWVSATGGRLSFEGSTWKDGEGATGEFSYSGDYPVYTITFVAPAGTVDRRATFADERTFELCSIRPNGALFDCHDFALDRPTLH
jgi:hypothetical protein